MRECTIKIFFNDNGQLSVDCDDFRIVDGSHYFAIKDGIKIMSFPFTSVKYTVTIINEI